MASDGTTAAAPIVVTPNVLRSWPMPAAGSKDERGSVLVAGGAVRTPGAVLLAGMAALRTGAGRLQLAVAAPVAGVLAVTVPEAMVLPLPSEERSGSVEPEGAEMIAETAQLMDTVVVGPGLDDEDRSSGLLERLLPALADHTTVLLDAYALRSIATDPKLADPVRGRLVLTPNLSEGAALLGVEDVGDDIVGAALDIARRYDATVSLQGRIATADGRAWHVDAGNPGLGTSGSGDVLAGLIGGFVARSKDGAQGAVWGTYLHSTGGDRLGARVGHLGFLARELLEEAPQILLELNAR